MKIKILSSLLTGILINSLIFNCTYANNSLKNESNQKTNMVVLFDSNYIDNTVKNIVVNSGGKIINEIPQIGGLEIQCNANVIPQINSIDSVYSISPNHIIKIKENTSINSNEYYKNLENDYYVDNTTGYYENSENDYYVDNTTGYYENTNNTYYEKNTVTDSLYNKYQWDIKKITNNGASFDIEDGNHDIIIGIIDSGVDIDHPELKDNFLGGKNLVPKKFLNDNTETGDINDVDDRFGHGTEVTGQIAANGQIKGAAPEIGFKSYRIFNHYGQTNASICANAIISAVNDNVKVINLSLSSFYLDGKCTWTDEDTGEIYDLGDDMADYSLLERAIKFASEHGVYVVTSAGNEGLDCSNNNMLTEYFNNLYKDQGFNYTGLMYQEPGSFEGVINVSATDKNDKIAPYSNYGQGFIDIAAPGGSNSDNIEELCLTTSKDGGHSFNFGTSLAAPKVSAAIGLLLCKNNNLTPSDIEKILYKNSIKYDETKYYGVGMLNIYSLLSNS